MTLTTTLLPLLFPALLIGGSLNSPSYPLGRGNSTAPIGGIHSHAPVDLPLFHSPAVMQAAHNQSPAPVVTASTGVEDGGSLGECCSTIPQPPGPPPPPRVPEPGAWELVVIGGLMVGMRVRKEKQCA